MSDLIGAERSVIVAADVERAQLQQLVQNTCMVEGIGGYKIGIQLALEDGLARVVSEVKNTSNLPVIYDHQKAGNDIPSMGQKFASVCKRGGVDAVILFPFGGAETEEAWIRATQDADLTPIVGGHMTQSRFLASEGGFVEDEAVDRIYQIAAEEGVTDFVVPGNKPEVIRHYKGVLDDILGAGNYVFYAPGFVKQGGVISDAAQVAGDSFHAIVGRGIHQAEDQRKAAQQMTSQLI